MLILISGLARAHFVFHRRCRTCQSGSFEGCTASRMELICTGLMRHQIRCGWVRGRLSLRESDRRCSMVTSTQARRSASVWKVCQQKQRQRAAAHVRHNADRRRTAPTLVQHRPDTAGAHHHHLAHTPRGTRSVAAATTDLGQMGPGSLVVEGHQDRLPHDQRQVRDHNGHYLPCGVYLANGVSAGFPSVSFRSRPTIGERDRKRVQSRLPPRYPSCLALACRVQ